MGAGPPESKCARLPRTSARNGLALCWCPQVSPPATTARQVPHALCAFGSRFDYRTGEIPRIARNHSKGLRQALSMLALERGTYRCHDSDGGGTDDQSAVGVVN